MSFQPFTGYYMSNLVRVSEQGDYYYDWIMEARKDPRPVALGGNYGTRAHLVLLDQNVIKEFFSRWDLEVGVRDEY